MMNILKNILFFIIKRLCVRPSSYDKPNSFSRLIGSIVMSSPCGFHSPISTHLPMPVPISSIY